MAVSMTVRHDLRKRASTRGRTLISAALALVLLPALSGAVQAQGSAEVQALMQKVERLQGELNDLQRRVYGGKVPEKAPESGGDAQSAETADAASGNGGSVPPAAAVRLQERIAALEEDLRDLTGNLEETQHTVRQVKDRLDTLVADVDLRLRDIEQRLDAAQVADAGSPGAEGTGADAAEATEDDRDGQAARASESGGEAVPGRQPKTLGQVPAEAIARLEDEAAARGSGDTDGDTPNKNTDADGANAAAAESESPDADSPDAEEADSDGAAVRASYKDAFELLRQADYAKAETAMRDFIEAHPEHTLAGNAQYWLGETFYVREDYEQAAVVFAEGFKTYPESRKAPDNLLKLGMSLARIDRAEDACGIFAELPKRFPDAAPNILQRAERERGRLDCDA